MKPEPRSTEHPVQSEGRKKSKMDAEVYAMQAISRIMNGVAPEARDRVMQYIVDRYALDSIHPSRVTVVETPDGMMP